ncbi:MAG: metal-dependent hydrolase [Methanomicrobiales archaeon]|nr:metal-dependent hydrolase [Methanomicrobiales archaeon]
MFLLCHLAAGLIIGLFLSLIFHKSNLIIPAVIGGIAPDLIDKPIGHLLLQQSLDYGRIYAHGLTFFGIVMICGILIWIKCRSLMGISFSLGVLSHQILDRMWNEPENWLYPFKGSFVPVPQINYIDNAIFREFFNPYEWLFALLIILIFAFSFPTILEKIKKTVIHILRTGGLFLSIICGISGLILLFPQNKSIGMILTRLDHQVDISLAAFIMIMTAFFAFYILNWNRFSRY